MFNNAQWFQWNFPGRYRLHSDSSTWVGRSCETAKLYQMREGPPQQSSVLQISTAQVFVFRLRARAETNSLIHHVHWHHVVISVTVTTLQKRLENYVEACISCVGYLVFPETMTSEGWIHRSRRTPANTKRVQKITYYINLQNKVFPSPGHASSTVSRSGTHRPGIWTCHSPTGNWFGHILAYSCNWAPKTN